MHSKWVRLLSVLVFSWAFSGCIVHTSGHRSRHRHAKSRRCRPSQYWDGHQCRHKGRGHGARKHDGYSKRGKDKNRKHSRRDY
jgi:hypothetical protein